MKRLTSLLLVEERLFEAEHFALLLAGKNSLELQYYLNAFLSAARSVTFLIQKELRHVSEFNSYWASIQNDLRADNAAKFFLELRNFSQKEGRVSLIGWGGTVKRPGYSYPSNLGEEPFMLYFFADGQSSVPVEVETDDIVVACLKHCARLANLVQRTIDRFPFESCPSTACSPEGAQHLKLELADFLEISGYPRDWIIGSREIPTAEAFRVVSKNFDAINTAAIVSIGEYSKLTTATSHR